MRTDPVDDLVTGIGERLRERSLEFAVGDCCGRDEMGLQPAVNTVFRSSPKESGGERSRKARTARDDNRSQRGRNTLTP
jgi:hypothetical protein